MWPAILKQHHIAPGAGVFADRHVMLETLSVPRGGVIAEIGVAFGDFSQVMLDTLQPKEFHAFDLFTMHTHDWLEAWGGRSLRETFNGRTHGDYYRTRFRSDTATGRMHIFEGDSSSLLTAQPDHSYDLIYIDGAHDYVGVKKDADASAQKIKPNGMLIFNDYIMHDHMTNTPYGVVHVVNDLCVTHGWRIAGFALQGAMFCDVALRRASC